MPPPQQLLVSGTRGFVCRACLSKLRGPRPERLQWSYRRNITNGKGPSRPWESGQAQEPAVTFRLWEETPDGKRVEIQPEPPAEEDDDGSSEQPVDSEGNPLGDINDPATRDRIVKEARNATTKFMESSTFKDPVKAETDLQDMKAFIDKVSKMDLDNLTPEERVKLRQEIMSGITWGIQLKLDILIY
jgi:hypothetical protein